MIKHSVIGAGYVGLPLSMYLKTLGEDVGIIDVDPIKLGMLAQGNNPLKGEPLPDSGFPRVSSYDEPADIYWVCVPTPSNLSGVDMSYIHSAIGIISKVAPGALIIIKSTIPQANWNSLCTKYKELCLAFSPEFLVQGKAYKCIKDTKRRYFSAVRFHPLNDYVVELLGLTPMQTDVVCHVKTLSNNLLATRLQLINTYALKVWYDLVIIKNTTPYNAHRIICQMLNAVGADPRIGTDYLDASIGYGGSCLNKDLLNMANSFDEDYMFALHHANDDTIREWFTNIVTYTQKLDKMGTIIKKITLVGKGFSALSPDERNSPTIKLDQMLEGGHRIVQYKEDVPYTAEDDELIINCRGVRSVPNSLHHLNLVFEANHEKTK